MNIRNRSPSACGCFERRQRNTPSVSTNSTSYSCVGWRGIPSPKLTPHIQGVTAPLAHRQINEKRNRISESFENKMRMKFECACRDEYGKGHGCSASMASYCEMLLLRKLPVRADILRRRRAYVLPRTSRR